jgi:hypothetical protein
MERLQHRESKHLVLAGPFGRQVGKTGNSHTVRELPINGRLDEVGREECERDRHVDLARSAALASGDAFGSGSGVGNKLVEPAASPRDRCDQDCTVLRPDWASTCRLCRFGYENITMSGG